MDTILFMLSLIGLIVCISYMTFYAILYFTKTPKVNFYTDKTCPYVYNRIPVRATNGSAGFDIYVPRNLICPAGETIIIDTGIKTQIPDGYVMHIYPRSSIGIKQHLMLANTVAVIDSDYRDTIKLAIHNYGTDAQQLNAGERIAQAVITAYITDGKKVNTKRNGGIGSTGR